MFNNVHSGFPDLRQHWNMYWLWNCSVVLRDDFATQKPNLFKATARSNSPHGLRFMAAFAIFLSTYLWSLVVSQDLDDPQKTRVRINMVPRSLNDSHGIGRLAWKTFYAFFLHREPEEPQWNLHHWQCKECKFDDTWKSWTNHSLLFLLPKNWRFKTPTTTSFIYIYIFINIYPTSPPHC